MWHRSSGIHLTTQCSDCRQHCGLHGSSQLLAALQVYSQLRKYSHSPDASHMPYKYVTLSQQSDNEESFLWERNHDDTPVSAPSRGGKCIINICIHRKRKREQEAACREQALHMKYHPALCYPILIALFLNLWITRSPVPRARTSPLLWTEQLGLGSAVPSQTLGVCRAGGTPASPQQRGAEGNGQILLLSGPGLFFSCCRCP